MVPAISCPSVKGHAMLGKPPLTKARSVPHTPHAETDSRTSSRPGAVVSTSTTSSGAPGDWIWAALWVDTRILMCHRAFGCPAAVVVDLPVLDAVEPAGAEPLGFSDRFQIGHGVG